MLKLWLCVFISAKFMAFTSASQQPLVCTVSYQNEEVDTTNAHERFYEANNALMGVCLYNQISTMGKENFITSLYPLLFRIAQLIEYAETSTQNELLNVLNFESMEEMREVVLVELEYFNTYIPYNYTATMRSLMMADNQYQFTDEFSSGFSSWIGGEAINLDFEDSSATADYLNNWMRQGSFNQDHDFLSSEQSFAGEGVISASSLDITVYWDNSFKPLKKVPINFYDSENNAISTSALYFEGYAKYNDDQKLNAKVIEFSLSGNWNMRLFFPNAGKKMDDLIFQIRNRSTYNNALANTKSIYLNLTLPIETEIYGFEDYSKGLKMANMMTEAMEIDSNLFSSGFKDGVGCHLSEMFHIMKISIQDLEDEEYVPEVYENSESDEINIVLDRPFFYEIICFAESRVYSGVVQKPKLLNN